MSTTIIANKVTLEGKSIFIRSNPVTGILALTSFVDNSAGTDGTHTFQKLFRYSTNGIIFTDWFALTVQNITSIQVSVKDVLIIELQYITNEPPGSTQLTVTSATIVGNSTATVSSYYFNNSIFSQYFGCDDVEVLNWEINVLDKLYQKGLLPDYIDRLNDMGSPDDFIEFWRSITKFFAYYVVYARKFQKFYESEALLSEYLEQRGLKISPANVIDELNYLMENFYKEIHHRGTMHIIDKSENGAAVDGELLRLINYYAPTDEFIFNLYKPEHFGFNLGNSSPMYRGMTINDNANKFYEPAVDVVDLSLYPTTGEVDVVTDGDHSVMRISSDTGGGIQTDGESNLKKIKVDPDMDYEFFFFIKKEDGNNFTVGFDAYDKDGGSVSLQSYKDGTDTNLYFNNINLQREDKYLGIRLFLYNQLKPPYANDKTSLHIGSDLKLKGNVTHVIPRVLVNGGGANLYNFRFVPMRTSYSRGFLNTQNFISAWFRNNNNQLNTLEVTKYIKKYLIPYNANIQVSTIANDGDYSIEQDIV